MRAPIEIFDALIIGLAQACRVAGTTSATALTVIAYALWNAQRQLPCRVLTGRLVRIVSDVCHVRILDARYRSILSKKAVLQPQITAYALD